MRRRISSPPRVTSRPSTEAPPSVGASRPQRMRIRVDLPEPLGPSRPKISPRRTWSDTRSSARTLPKSRETDRDLDAGPGIARVRRGGGRPGHGASRTVAAMPGFSSGVGLDRHLHAEDLVHPLVERLDVARRVLSLLPDLDDAAGELAAGKRVDGDVRRLADAHADPGAARARRPGPRSGRARGSSRPADRRPTRSPGRRSMVWILPSAGARTIEVFPLALQVRELALLGRQRRSGGLRCPRGGSRARSREGFRARSAPRWRRRRRPPARSPLRAGGPQAAGARARRSRRRRARGRAPPTADPGAPCRRPRVRRRRGPAARGSAGRGNRARARPAAGLSGPRPLRPRRTASTLPPTSDPTSASRASIVPDSTRGFSRRNNPERQAHQPPPAARARRTRTGTAFFIGASSRRRGRLASRRRAGCRGSGAAGSAG